MLSILIQWLETETVRLSHLRDRASEKGRRKEYPLLFDFFFFFLLSLFMHIVLLFIMFLSCAAVLNMH